MATGNASTVEPRRRLIACLGQALLQDGGVPPSLEKRVRHAAEVYRRLSKEQGGASLYVSGADVAGGGRLTPEGEVMAQLLQREHGVAAADIDKDVEARTTMGNAKMALAPIRRRGAAEVILVTSDFHCPRAKFIFRTVFRAGDAAELVLTVEPASSELERAPIRSHLPEDINDWSCFERISHEASRLEPDMRQLECEGFPSHPADVEEAAASLMQLAREMAEAPMPRCGCGPCQEDGSVALFATR